MGEGEGRLNDGNGAFSSRVLGGLCVWAVRLLIPAAKQRVRAAGHRSLSMQCTCVRLVSRNQRRLFYSVSVLLMRFAHSCSHAACVWQLGGLQQYVAIASIWPLGRLLTFPVGVDGLV
mmetsp:Transcript_20442/g.28707  ORF Transcript_20442/g.28707 Transcript_20442/m.28707 type:complete len:118 (+) Transcript_20442:532-885(+)